MKPSLKNSILVLIILLMSAIGPRVDAKTSELTDMFSKTEKERIRKVAATKAGKNALDTLLAVANTIHHEKRKRKRVSSSTRNKFEQAAILLNNTFLEEQLSFSLEEYLVKVQSLNRNRRYNDAIPMEQAAILMHRRMNWADALLYREALAALILRSGIGGLESLLVNAMDYELRNGYQDVLSAVKKIYSKNQRQLNTKAPLIIYRITDRRFISVNGAVFGPLVEEMVYLAENNLGGSGILDALEMATCRMTATSLARSSQLPGTSGGSVPRLSSQISAPTDASTPWQNGIYSAGNSSGASAVDDLIAGVCGHGSKGSSRGDAPSGNLRHFVQGECESLLNKSMTIIGGTAFSGSGSCHTLVAEIALISSVMGHLGNDTTLFGSKSSSHVSKKSWLADGNISISINPFKNVLGAPTPVPMPNTAAIVAVGKGAVSAAKLVSAGNEAGVNKSVVSVSKSGSKQSIAIQNANKTREAKQKRTAAEKEKKAADEKQGNNNSQDLASRPDNQDFNENQNNTMQCLKGRIDSEKSNAGSRGKGQLIGGRPSGYGDPMPSGQLESWKGCDDNWFSGNSSIARYVGGRPSTSSFSRLYIQDFQARFKKQICLQGFSNDTGFCGNATRR